MKNRLSITVYFAFIGLASISCANGEHKDLLSLQYIGITYHPGGGNAPEIYPRKFDQQAYFVAELGAALSYDRAIHGRFFPRLSLAFYRDCANVDAGYLHLGGRGIILSKGKHQINGGIGPTLVFRKDWHQFDEYPGDDFYGNSIWRGWQYRFILYGGEFDYLYRLSDKMELHYSIIPGYPFVFTSKIGVRFGVSERLPSDGS